MTTWLVSVPTRDRMLSAMRLSRPVAVMAAARNSAAATSTSAVLAKPLKASVERAAGAEQHLGIGHARRQAEQERHQRGDHDRRDGVVDRFGHPDDDGEGENREHAMTRDRQAGRCRQHQDSDQRGDCGQQTPIRCEPAFFACGGLNNRASGWLSGNRHGSPPAIKIPQWRYHRRRATKDVETDQLSARRELRNCP